MADTPGMQEALQIPLHPNLTGEDASVKQLFGKGEDEPFTSEDVLALEELLKSTNGGQHPENPRLAIQRAKAMFHRREENEKKFAENPQSFIQGGQEKATSLIETDPQKRAQLQAKAGQAPPVDNPRRRRQHAGSYGAGGNTNGPPEILL